MSKAEYSAMKNSGGLTYMKGKELFVSTRAAYSRGYLRKPGYDVLIKFDMKPGAMKYFDEVGVFHRTSAGSAGWPTEGIYCGNLRGVLNLGIQQNTHMFNSWLDNFKIIE